MRDQLSAGDQFSVFDNHQIMSKLETFVASWRTKGRPPLFAASLDIKKCYDSVNLERLLQLFNEDSSIRQNYFICSFFKFMKNKRFFFENPDEIKLQTFFVGKKREISNQIG